MSHLLVMKYFFTDFALAGVRRQVLYVFLGDAASETGHLAHSVQVVQLILNFVEEVRLQYYSAQPLSLFFL
jgi:hypothetical protein